MSPTQIRTNPNTISLKGSNHIISLDLEKVASEKLSNNNTSKNLKDSSKESNNLKKNLGNIYILEMNLHMIFKRGLVRSSCPNSKDPRILN